MDARPAIDWLLNNPISEMPGPLFLALYAAVLVAIFIEASFRSRRADRSEDLGPPPIPIKPDPIEIAYLRGGENEVTRLVVFGLLGRGYLRVRETKRLTSKVTESRIEQEPTPPEIERLSPLESDAYRYFQTPRKPEVLFQAGNLASRVKARLGEVTESLRERQLLPSPGRYASAWRIWLGGAIMILAFGGFKLGIALAKGRHNVAFLIAFALIGLVLLGLSCKVPRLTRRGKDYLAKLREAFGGLKPPILDASKPDLYDPDLLLVSAIFGVSALAGSRYGYVPDLFRSAAANSGSCGGGCGSSASCGGGGGCGGGGCGGCGGCGS